MSDEKKEAFNFFNWGIGLVGIGAYIVVVGMTITRLLNGSTIYWGRGVVILIIGTICILYSKRASKKNTS